MNQKGIDLIKSTEGCKLKAYRDTGNVLTIGWGHTGPDVKEGLIWSQEQADAALKKDITKTEKDLLKLIKVDLNENQLSALVSFVFNIGIGQFKSSTLLKKLNAGDYEEAANQLLRWNKDNGKVLNGLIKRRSWEKTLFLTKVD